MQENRRVIILRIACVNSCWGTYFVWVHVGSSSLVWAHLGSGSSERIYLPGQGRPESKIDPNGIVFKHAGPEPEMLTFPINFLFKTVYFQLRLPSLPFREPDPSQKCLHF